MPIFLEAPRYKPGGPDGQGWNRLSLNAHTDGENRAHCALRPRTYAALWESQDTRRARWGGFESCVGGNRCDSCTVMGATPRRLRSFTPDVLVRLMPSTEGLPDEPHLMNKPEQGWDSSSVRWTWDELARLRAWRLGARHHDEHGEGFWLHAVTPADHGIYG